MSRFNRAEKVYDLTVTLESAQTTLPAPSSSSDGGDVTGWDDPTTASRNKPLRRRYKSFALSLDSAGTVTLSDAILYGYDSNESVWRALASLNNGADIALTSSIGWERPIEMAVGFDRFAVGATMSGAVAVTVKATPYREF